MPEQDKYAKLEAWARSRWSSVQERVFQWSGEVRPALTRSAFLKGSYKRAGRLIWSWRKPTWLLLPSEGVLQCPWAISVVSREAGLPSWLTTQAWLRAGV